MDQFPDWTPHGSVLEVKIDIKPGSFPNSINPANNGKVPVAILTTKDFDATAVDPLTVRFGPNGTEAPVVHYAPEDVNLDGRTDMVFHFIVMDTGINCNNLVGNLTGKTIAGLSIHGSDSINVLGCR